MQKQSAAPRSAWKATTKTAASGNLARAAQRSVRLTYINAGPQALVARWGMTDKDEVDPKTDRDEATAETPDPPWPIAFIKVVIFLGCIIVFGGLMLWIIALFISQLFFGIY